MSLPEMSLQFLADGSVFSVTILVGLASTLTFYALTRWIEFLLGAAMMLTVMFPLALR